MTMTQSVDWVVSHQNTLWICTGALFLLFAWAEKSFPRRPTQIPKSLRWVHNLSLALLNFLILRLISPGAVLLAANTALNHHFGFFNWVELPIDFSVFWSLIILDITVYYEHRALHFFPPLWKIHRVHHADMEMDVTTAVRFHPLEVILSWTVKFLIIFLWGLPVMGVFLFEIILMASSLFSHSNLRLPPVLEQILRLFFVTPEMHRIHHSVLKAEANSDFGFIGSFWDKIFGTYLAEPQKGQIQMKVGLDFFEKPQYLKGDQMLLMPFMDHKGRPAWKHLAEAD